MPVSPCLWGGNWEPATEMGSQTKKPWPAPSPIFYGGEGLVFKFDLKICIVTPAPHVLCGVFLLVFEYK